MARYQSTQFTIFSKGDIEMSLKSLLIGEKLRSDEAQHQRLTKWKGLAVLSSDSLSITAYSTEAILLVLIAAGSAGTTLLTPLALAIAALMMVVAFSYYQTIHAYPNGGGAYIVATENLGKWPGLVAGAALLIDYILTVSVSVSAGTAALTSAFPELSGIRVLMALLIVGLITLINLRGVSDSGTFFSVPTYMFIAGILMVLVVGTVRILTGSLEPTIQTEGLHMVSHELTLFLILRAFAAGCTALTGIEAISNGIPVFKKPESKNAGQTLVAMVILLVTMFVGVTLVASYLRVMPIHEGETILSQITGRILGEGSVLYYYVQISTLLILSLAANTAYADFPRLAALISKDGYLPRQMRNLGDRLVFADGIRVLAIISGALIVVFGAQEHNILPLYAVGVFLSFTLSQSGMVVHWWKEPEAQGRIIKMMLNGLGALSTGVVAVILGMTKFAEGAWMVFVAMPLVIGMFLYIHSHYKNVAAGLSLNNLPKGYVFPSSFNKTQMPVVVLMNNITMSTLKALEYAVQISANVRILCISINGEEQVLREKMARLGIQLPLDVIKSPYREVGRPLIEYLHRLDETSGMTASVVIPKFVTSKPFDRYLHNQTTKIFKRWLYSDEVYGKVARPFITIPYRLKANKQNES